MAEQHSFFIDIGNDVYNPEIQITHIHSNYNNGIFVTQLSFVKKIQI